MAILKLTGRSIRSFFGRYMALLLIVALSVAFFSGLKVTKEAMWNTAEKYLTEQKLYDFRLLSTVGFETSAIDRIAEEAYVAEAEGGQSLDALIARDEKIAAYHLMSLPESVNVPTLTAGRMPETASECLADKLRFTEEDIGTTIVLAEGNEDSVWDSLERTEYTIVGLVDSPLYLGLDRGSTDIGSGTLSAFLYLPKENFTADYYTELYVTIRDRATIYSDAYEDQIEEYEDAVTELAESLTEERYQAILEEQGLTEEIAEQLGLSKPVTYVLTREENAGYLNFKNDTSIVSGIANIFPLFFILVAMLVCITTMTRMVSEERTQIGTLKALGYSDGRVIAKYMLYAGSATLLGWGSGFFLGTYGLPKIFWLAYNALYSFAPIRYQFSLPLALSTLGASLTGILGSAWLSCRGELLEVPASLIRPKGLKKGKRILLERITPLWHRLHFLTKVTLRNMFRYKKRFIMMVIGIGCCAGLVVTAFGVRDSMIGVGTWQYGEIQHYSLSATFTPGQAEELTEQLQELLTIEDYLLCRSESVTLHSEKELESVTLYTFKDAEAVLNYWDFHQDDETIAFPAKGEVLLSSQAAERLELAVGDSLTIVDTDDASLTVTVSGIFDNYVGHYVIASEETARSGWGEKDTNTVLLQVEEEEKTAEELTKLEEITGVTQMSERRERLDQALSCVNYIIWMVVAFSGTLAFIVIFNLTNINLAERSREIATVEVLGFYPIETYRYILNENLILSILAAFVGLPLGTFFHRVVMSMIDIEMIAFHVQITTRSYLLSVIVTISFAAVVNVLMRRQIGKIKMAESLKAVE